LSLGRIVVFDATFVDAFDVVQTVDKDGFLLTVKAASVVIFIDVLDDFDGRRTDANLNRVGRFDGILWRRN
jgi:hypothetical protein